MFNILKPSFWFHKRESELSAETVRIEQMGRFNALFHLDPDRIVDAVTQYKAGTLGPLARIIEDFEDRDDKMKACSMKMRASAARCDYSILIAEGYEKDGRARLHQEILQRFWSTVRATDRFKTNERGGIRLLKKQMMDAQSYGFSVHEIVWRPLPNGEIAGEFIRLPLWHFENRTGELRFIPTATGYDGVRMPEGGWMVTTGDGVGVAAAIIAMSKHLAWQDWLLFSERCGIPILHAATGAAKGTPAWEGICAAVRRAARDFRLVTDQGTRLSAIETGHASNIPYPELVDHADRAIAALYRGADLSTISKGDGTGASLQGDETNMLEQDACANLGETLHEQVDRFVIRYATGDETPLARISIDPVDKPDVDSDIKIDNHLANLGVKLSKREALQRYGRSEAESDDDALEPRPATPPDAPTGGFGAFANEESAPDARKGLCMGLKTTPRGSDWQGEGEDNRALLEAFSRDTGPAAAAVKELIENPTREAAKELLGKLPSLLPADPALEAVIAEAMAGEFKLNVQSTSLANIVDANGSSHSASDGRFDGGNGGGRKREPETKPQHDRYGSTDEKTLSTDSQKNFKRGANALEALERMRGGYIDKAMYREETGWIRFDWGDPGDPNSKPVQFAHGHGISHILAKHGKDAKKLPDVISNGKAVKNPDEPDKTYLVTETAYAVVIPLNQSQRRMLTMFEPKPNSKKLAEIKNYPPAPKRQGM